MRILVAGSSGQLAHALARTALPSQDWSIRCVGRPELDVTSPESIRRAIGKSGADILVNAAAYTAVDKAESEPDEAFAINETGAASLASAAAEAGIPVIHLSTDYVFSGESIQAYRELDVPSPLNVYGRSKLAGEQAVAAANPEHVIVRTSWVFSEWGHNFLRTMLRLGAEREELRIVSDQTGTPTYAHDLAGGIVAICQRLAEPRAGEKPWGLYHLTNAGTTTWHGFATEIFRLATRHGYKAPRLVAIPTSEYPTPSARPVSGVLDNRKVGEVFGVRLRDWREATEVCVDRLLRM